MNEDWERELRQRALVAQVLSDYRNGGLSLRRLSEDLYSLAQQFRLAPDDWVSEFQAEANGLEALYAVALDQEISHHLPELYLQYAQEAVDRIEVMMLQLEAPPDEDDD